MKIPFKYAVGTVLILLGATAPWLVSAYELSLLGRFLALSILAMGIMLTWGEAGRTGLAMDQ